MEQEFESLVQEISKMDLDEVGRAVAILWYHDHKDKDYSTTASQLASELEGLGLAKTINRSRFKGKLRTQREVVFHQKTEKFSIAVASQRSLDTKYLPVLGKHVVQVSHLLLPAVMFENTRPYLERMAVEANGCYEHGFYDGCAVMCRRIAESLLISVFENVKQADKIKRNDQYLMFGDIIAVAKGGKYFHMARGLDKSLDDIKKLGDRAAHDRFYLTPKTDIDPLASDIRSALTHLLAMSGIQQSKAQGS